MLNRSSTILYDITVIETTIHDMRKFFATKELLYLGNTRFEACYAFLPSLLLHRSRLSGELDQHFEARYIMQYGRYNGWFYLCDISPL